MGEIDEVLARLARATPPCSLGDDPAFVARLDASATQGAMLGMARSAATGFVAAALMMAVHGGTMSSAQAGGAPLLTTAEGVVL